MTRVEVAALLRCTTRGLDKMVSRGTFLAPSRIGGLVRWNRERVMQFIDAAATVREVAGA
ncbi:helix-turn-helix transcriptional regulator [Planctomyces sp. SH-PL14]|uniref:helix-turn-helix transcriptional regulator n=1 Tax=Planctomyces sp. SH-PL14 TaxID=1632864 RepID=UPI0012E86937|nr:hypothetical protein [Planctomyces sp. SH-PL14]